MDSKFTLQEKSFRGKYLDDNKAIGSISYIKDLLNALPHMAAILNEQRQIVYANQVFSASLGGFSLEHILGKRTGEILSCVNSKKGCGSSVNCRICGVVSAIMESMKYKRKVMKECRITSAVNSQEVALDFMVTSSPFTWEKHKFFILTLTDISHEKRRRVLEKVFFHDVINKAGSLSGFIDSLKDIQDATTIKEHLKIAEIISNELTDEILAQRALLAAENNDLEVEPKPVFSLNILKKNVEQVKQHPVAANKHIEIAHESVNITITTDPLLLGRIFTNMIKNALEAILENDKIEVGCISQNNEIVFWVHNNSVMSEDIKLQVFQRSFSTKGLNRGLGTYSITLLGERYLKGKVYFTSEEGMGTTFFIKLPLH